MKKNTPSITYTLVPTSDIERIALIHESRKKLETILSARSISDARIFCFGKIENRIVSSYTDEEFKRLLPDHGYEFVLRVLPTEDGYTATQTLEKAVSGPWIPDGHPLVVRINNGKPYKKRDFEKSDEETHKKIESLVGCVYSGDAAIIKDFFNKIEPIEFGYFIEIDKDKAKKAHQLSIALGRQIDETVEQILSKLHAIIAIHGSEAIFENPANKIIFTVEISGTHDQLSNKVYHVVDIDDHSPATEKHLDDKAQESSTLETKRGDQ